MSRFYRSLFLASIFAFLSSSAVLAQGRNVTGTVTDETGSALPGVNIVIKGSTSGTTSDMSGNFTLSVPNDNTTLVFSFVGYATSEVVVGSRTVVNVQMTMDVRTLSELVVTGYATQEKKDLTGSVGTVKPVDLVSIPVGNVANQLQGRIAGVTVVGDGQPGSTARVRIRGFASFTNNAPLYIVDGVPTQDISTLNPNDIENLSVLKDAGAASIYGSRASNGVIIITTKRGTSGVKVNFDMYYGTQNPGKQENRTGVKNMLTTQEYADLQWLVYRNDGFNETHPIYGPSTNPTPTLPSWAADTRWYDEITRSAPIQNYDLSMSGGNQDAKFYIGLNYFDQQGVVLENYTKRFAVRANSEFKIKDRVTVGENLTVSYRQSLGVGQLEEGSPFQMGVYRTQPIIPVIMSQQVQGINYLFRPGDFGGTGLAQRLGQSSNVVADRTRAADNLNFDVRAIGSVFTDVKIMEGLNFRTTFGGTFQNGYYSNYTFATYERSENIGTPSLNEGAYYNSDWNWTNTLTYNKTFGSHKILAVGGYEAVKYGIGRGVNGIRAGFFSDAVSFRTLNNGASIVNTSSYFNTPVTLASLFLRADYSFADKYLLSATVRRDGSSVFGEENRYGVFPSVTAGWRISEEGFLSGTEFITDLKIRGGYGTMGNQFGANPANPFFLYGGSIASSFYDITGSGTGSVQGFRPTRIGNPAAKWETNITTNIGFDAGLFDNKLEIVFDWYSKVTEDLLFTPELPGTAGGAGAPAVNIGSMKNTGIDLQLIYRKNFTNDFRFESNLVFTTYKNTITGLAPGFEFFDSGGSRIGPFARNAVGNPVSSFFGYQVLGLFQSASEVASAPTQDGAAPGFFRFADINEDGIIDQDDRTFIGNPNPDFTYGLNLSLGYKNFDLTMFFLGSQGNDIFNYNKWWTDFWPSFQGQKSRELLNNSWTPERTNTNVPRASQESNFSTNTQSTSYYIEDGSFLRLKNIQLGYNLPKNAIAKAGLSNARVYVQGVNLFTITGYSGLDPELSGADTAFGIDAGNYPLVKQFLFGINLGF
ncbi:MAG: TonB-dependent receptor [Cyclobacteriaceae bacterium]|nr:TonB-dependent receptor [Cyclobacteriaceae bacterium]